MLLWLPTFSVWSWQQPSSCSSSSGRRDALRQLGGAILVSSPATAGIVGWAAVPDPARAVRGAAELDFEYYMRDLMGGNKQEGNVSPSAPPAVAPPRTLQEPLLSAMLTDDFSTSAIPVAVLAQTVQKMTPARSLDDVVQQIQKTATGIRDKASRSFYARAPWQNPTVSDQYYMDLSAYALWRTAAEVLPNYVDRDAFVRDVGRALYRKMVSTGVVDAPTKTTGIVGTVSSVRQILDAFCQSNYCKAYRLGPDEPAVAIPKNKKKNKEATALPPEPIVDELDDEALASGGSVDFLVSVMEPATLGAALQITGEQSRFAPDLVGPTLAALWEDAAGLVCTWETFFIDPVYRPNPKDYFPTEQLLQYTIKMP